jgi:hypothetical protein
MRRLKVNRLLRLLVLIALATAIWGKSHAAAQDTPLADSTHPLTIPDTTFVPSSAVGSDTVTLEPNLYHPDADTILINAYRSDATPRRFPSPTLTMFKSVAFPGWGQYTNRKYLKAGLVFVVESYFIYQSVYFARKASDWRDKWRAAPEDQKVQYFNKYSSYRDTRNSNLWYTALVVFLSMFDAYVDAHLATFPEKASSGDRITVGVTGGDELRLVMETHF